jgi:CRISPR-associated protein Cas5t
MLALTVSVPVACFRKGFAREYWETEDLPPPSTCYGFLLSLVGELDRRRHVGVRICPALLNQPARSTVLRILWRIKERHAPQGAGTNIRPDYQELLTGVRLALWVDSSLEQSPGPTLEERVAIALEHPERVHRFGGLSLGESTHLVDEVRKLGSRDHGPASAYLLGATGRLSLPVWVDHVGSSGTRYVTGDLTPIDLSSVPPTERMPRIEPPQ